MRSIFTAALTLAAATVSLPASAAYYVTSVTMANSSYTSAYACTIQLSTSPTATTGTTYLVDDVTGRFDAICSGAAMAMYFNDDVSVSTSTSGGYTYITSLASSETSGNIPYYTTHGTTTTNWKDHCVATMTTSSGSVAAGVDDDNPEEHVTCAALALMHFYGSASFTLSLASTGEINTIQMSY